MSKTESQNSIISTKLTIALKITLCGCDTLVDIYKLIPLGHVAGRPFAGTDGVHKPVSA